MKKFVIFTILALSVTQSLKADLAVFSGVYSVEFDPLKENHQGVQELSGSYRFQFDLNEAPNTKSFEITGISIDDFSVLPGSIGATQLLASDMQVSLWGSYGNWEGFTITPFQGSLASNDYLSLTFETFNGYDASTSTYTNALDWVDLNVATESGFFSGDHLNVSHGAIFDGTINIDTIPEPSSVLLLAVGSGGVIFYRRTKRGRSRGQMFRN